jgi:hypothetical protein
MASGIMETGGPDYPIKTTFSIAMIVPPPEKLRTADI